MKFSKSSALIAVSLGLIFNSVESFAKAPGEVRHFSYPTDYVTGRMELHGKSALLSDGTNLGPVKGKFDVFVPTNKLLAMELNVRMLGDKDKLHKFSTTGIDILKVSCMSLDDSDVSICSAALKEIPKFDHPVQIDCDRSDVTDQGFSNFQSLEQTTLITCFCSGVHGNFLKDWKRMQSLETLSLMTNPIIGENLRYLKNLKKLKTLVLNQTNARDSSLAYVGECTELTKLDLSKNDQLTDEGIKRLASCTKLKQLELNWLPKLTNKSIETIRKLPQLDTVGLNGTSITADGLLPLVSLHLKFLRLPKRFYKVEMDKLQKSFAGTTLIFDSGAVSQEQMEQWAPLK